MLLRPRDGAFEVVGNCLVLDYHDAVAFLGTLDKSCRVVLPGDNHGGIRSRFRCSSRTTEIDKQHGSSILDDEKEADYAESEVEEQDTIHDPRLGPLPEGWRWIETVRTNNDPFIFETFENSVTGEKMNSDPRMLPDALRARGVKLDWFELV